MKENLKLSDQLCFPIYTLSKEIINMYRPFLADLDVTYPQYLVLLVLWEHRKMNVSEIGEMLRLDSGTLTPLLKRLESKGIINRQRSAIDERIVEITLTERGNVLREKAICIPQKMMAHIDLSQEEQIQFGTIIDKILNNIKV